MFHILYVMWRLVVWCEKLGWGKSWRIEFFYLTFESIQHLFTPDCFYAIAANSDKVNGSNICWLLISHMPFLPFESKTGFSDVCCRSVEPFEGLEPIAVPIINRFHDAANGHLAVAVMFTCISCSLNVCISSKSPLSSDFVIILSPLLSIHNPPLLLGLHRYTILREQFETLLSCEIATSVIIAPIQWLKWS
jgi:hypothetical protein